MLFISYTFQLHINPLLWDCTIYMAMKRQDENQYDYKRALKDSSVWKDAIIGP